MGEDVALGVTQAACNGGEDHEGCRPVKRNLVVNQSPLVSGKGCREFYQSCEYDVIISADAGF